MKGLRLAVLGAGRSGVAIAKAAKELGAEPTVYDAKPQSALADSSSKLMAEGIALETGFQGRFEPSNVDMIVTSPGVDYRSSVLQRAKSSGIHIIGEIEFAYRISAAPIVAITGTNGKSTTTVMMTLCLQALGHEAVLCGNVYGTGYSEAPLTEAAANSTKSQVLVAEISSFQLEWVQDFRPRCAAITNIKPDHLNRYDSFEDYAKTKHRIYARMAEGDDYVCHADPMTEPRIREPKFEVVHTVVEHDRFRVGQEEVEFQTLPFQGAHNYENAAMACLLGLAFHSGQSRKFSRKDVDDAAAGLRRFHGLSHRMERVGERHGIALINNSMCTNPEAVLASSRSLGCGHQLLLVGGVAKDLDFAPLQPYLRATGFEVYLYGEDGSKINSQLGGDYSVFRTMAEAFQAAIKAANPGDVILLAPGCASLDQYSDFRARGDEFVQLAKEWLKHEQTVSH